MLDGVVVREIAKDVLEEAALRARTRMREGRPEVYFLLSDAERVLPVCLAGQTVILRWGNRSRQSQTLPITAWARTDSLTTGGWASLRPEEATIPASRALDNGIWYDVREGVRAVVVRDEAGELAVYPLVESASHYYRAMTGSEWMPCLVRQRI